MKRFLALSLTLVMALSLAACGGKSEEKASGENEPAASGADDGYLISVILKTTSSEYWQYIIAGAEAYEKDHPNVTVEVKGPPSETSYDEQQNMIETDMNNADIDGYVIAPLQSDMVATMIRGQTKPIIALDTKIDAPEVLSFVGTGNEAAAKMGGEAAVALAKEQGWTEINCIEIAGVQGDSTNTARMDGYRAGVTEAGGTFLDDEIQYANALADQAVTCMEAIMQNHPEGVAIICANNEDMAIAAALAAAGNEAFKDTVFLGFDGCQAGCNAILDGQLTLDVCQQGFDMAYKAVDACVRALEGETLDAFIDSGASIMDASNAKERLELLKSYMS